MSLFQSHQVRKLYNDVEELKTAVKRFEEALSAADKHTRGKDKTTENALLSEMSITLRTIKDRTTNVVASSAAMAIKPK